VVALPALAAATDATRGLAWPYDVDFYREIAQAEVFAAGDWGSEAFYLEERLWYPPLGPALVATVAGASGLPIPFVYARIGPFANFAAPVFLYLLARRAFGPVAALAATIDYIYLRASWLPGWAAGSYSPWLHGGNLSQVFFLGSLWAYHAALERPARRRYAAAGIGLALAALAHASAALILGGVVATSAVLELRHAAKRRTAACSHLLLLLCSGLVLAPYLALLAGHYWNGVLNAAPAQWVWHGASSWSLVARQLGWALLLVPVGLWTLAMRRSGRGERLVLLWLGICCGLIAASAVVSLVPLHHLVAYLRLCLSIVVGVGAAALLGRLVPFPGSAVRRWAPLAAAGLAAVALLPSYAGRRDQGRARSTAERLGSRSNRLEAYAWLREHAPPRSVVLASDELSMQVAAPAGCRVVAVPSLWASPFVDNEARRRDRRALLAALEDGDPERFCALASRYGLTHILRARREGRLPGVGVRPLLTRAFDNGKIYVESVDGCPTSAADAARGS
jgi:hypothetical protein